MLSARSGSGDSSPRVRAVGRWPWQSDEINAGYKAAKNPDDSGLAAAEQKIAQNLNDVPPRLVVIEYTKQHNSAGSAAVRLRQVRWLAENSPRFELRAAPRATPRREQSGTEDYEALRKLRVQKVEESPSDLVILDHATNFLRIANPAAAERALWEELR